MSARAAHLGMSSLDTDHAAAAAAATATGNAEALDADAAGWVQIPPALREGILRKRRMLREELTPEQRKRIALEEAAEAVLDVLAEVDWTATATATATATGGDGGDEGSGDGKGRVGLEVRCLAWGYLSLMLVPRVPRAWLREVMRERYGALCGFVGAFGPEVWPAAAAGGEEVERALVALPWGERSEAAVAGAPSPGLAGRFVVELGGDVPYVGELWRNWWGDRRWATVLAGRRGGLSGTRWTGAVASLLTTGVLAALVCAGVYLPRIVVGLGAPAQTWRPSTVAAVGLSGLGAAGAMFANIDLGA